MSPPAPVTVGPSPLKILGKIAIASVAVTVGVAVFVVVWGSFVAPSLLSHARVILICTVAVLACYCGLAVLGAAVWRRPRVEIDPGGFTDYGIVGRRSRRWGDVEGGFVVIRASVQLVVAYRLTGAFKESTRITPLASLKGYDEAILVAGELALGARELAELLNQRKQGVPGAAASA